MPSSSELHLLAPGSCQLPLYRSFLKCPFFLFLKKKKTQTSFSQSIPLLSAKTKVQFRRLLTDYTSVEINPGLDFTSLTCPALPAKSNTHLWVQPLVSPHTLLLNLWMFSQQAGKIWPCSPALSSSAASFWAGGGQGGLLPTSSSLFWPELRGFHPPELDACTGSLSCSLWLSWGGFNEPG